MQLDHERPPQLRLILVDRNLLLGEMNIRKRQLCVKGFLGILG
jgi:hypothetical protein